MLVITLSDHWFSHALTMQTHCCMVPGKRISDVCSASKTKRLEFAWARGLFSSAHLLCSLHWLPVKERIMFKILLFVYKFFQRQSASYISENFTLYNTDGPGGCRGLHSSSDVTRLVVPRSKGKAGDSSILCCCALDGLISTGNSWHRKIYTKWVSSYNSTVWLFYVLPILNRI